jgi:hypothetical protein
MQWHPVSLRLIIRVVWRFFTKRKPHCSRGVGHDNIHCNTGMVSFIQFTSIQTLRRMTTFHNKCHKNQEVYRSNTNYIYDRTAKYKLCLMDVLIGFYKINTKGRVTKRQRHLNWHPIIPGAILHLHSTTYTTITSWNHPWLKQYSFLVLCTLPLYSAWYTCPSVLDISPFVIHTHKQHVKMAVLLNYYHKQKY